MSLKEELRHLTNQTKPQKFPSWVVGEVLKGIHEELRSAAKEGEDYADIGISTQGFDALPFEDKREAILTVARSLRDEGLVVHAYEPARMPLRNSAEVWSVTVYWGDESDGS
jgi:prophage antirepressor-like protein